MVDRWLRAKFGLDPLVNGRTDGRLHHGSCPGDKDKNQCLLLSFVTLCLISTGVLMYLLNR